MLQIIIPALATAYVIRKQHTSAQSIRAKSAMLQRLNEQKLNLLNELEEFRATHNYGLLNLHELQDPFKLAEPDFDVVKFGHSLLNNARVKKITFIAQILQNNVIDDIEDLAVIEWLDLHINYILKMVDAFYMNYETVSYATIANLYEKKKILCNDGEYNPEELKNIECNIATEKVIIRFTEDLLNQYHQLICYCVATKNVSHKNYEALTECLNTLKILLTERKPLESFHTTQQKIRELEGELTRQTLDWQIYRTQALLARYRSQLFAISMDLYLTNILTIFAADIHFYEPNWEMLNHLKEYLTLQNELEAFFKNRYPLRYVKGDKIFDREHKVYYFPLELKQRLGDLISKLRIPFPNANVVFEHYSPTDELVKPSLRFTGQEITRSGPPIVPARPTEESKRKFLASHKAKPTFGG